MDQFYSMILMQSYSAGQNDTPSHKTTQKQTCGGIQALKA
jgi:hypothetical protein